MGGILINCIKLKNYKILRIIKQQQLKKVIDDKCRLNLFKNHHNNALKKNLKFILNLKF